jgi:hypothetical protein
MTDFQELGLQSERAAGLSLPVAQTCAETAGADAFCLWFSLILDSVSFLREGPRRYLGPRTSFTPCVLPPGVSFRLLPFYRPVPYHIQIYTFDFTLGDLSRRRRGHTRCL